MLVTHGGAAPNMDLLHCDGAHLAALRRYARLSFTYCYLQQQQKVSRRDVSCTSPLTATSPPLQARAPVPSGPPRGPWCGWATASRSTAPSSAGARAPCTTPPPWRAMRSTTQPLCILTWPTSPGTRPTAASATAPAPQTPAARTSPPDVSLSPGRRFCTVLLPLDS